MIPRWMAWALVSGALLLGCSRTEPPTAAGLRVGLVTDVGKVDDRSFNQATWEGLQNAKKDLPAVTELRFVETADPRDYAKNIAQFAEAGYDCVVTVGFALAEATYAAARRYPNTRFLGVDQFLARDAGHPDWPLPNLAGLVFDEGKAGYLAGALAALVSRTRSVGAVLSTDAVPPLKRFGEGFRAGARSIDPAVAVSVVYHNDVGFDRTFTDPEWGRTTALALIDRGADVLFCAGGKTGNGGLLGCAERGVAAIGVDTDQYFTVPAARKVLLTSAIKDLTGGTAGAITEVAAGTFQGGLRVGSVGLAPFHELEDRVSEAARAKLREVEAALAEGRPDARAAPKP